MIQSDIIILEPVLERSLSKFLVEIVYGTVAKRKNGSNRSSNFAQVFIFFVVSLFFCFVLCQTSYKLLCNAMLLMWRGVSKSSICSVNIWIPCILVLRPFNAFYYYYYYLRQMIWFFYPNTSNTYYSWLTAFNLQPSVFSLTTVVEICD